MLPAWETHSIKHSGATEACTLRDQATACASGLHPRLGAQSPLSLLDPLLLRALFAAHLCTPAALVGTLSPPAHRTADGAALVPHVYLLRPCCRPLALPLGEALPPGDVWGSSRRLELSALTSTTAVSVLTWLDPSRQVERATAFVHDSRSGELRLSLSWRRSLPLARGFPADAADPEAFGGETTLHAVLTEDGRESLALVPGRKYVGERQRLVLVSLSCGSAGSTSAIDLSPGLLDCVDPDLDELGDETERPPEEVERRPRIVWSKLTRAQWVHRGLLALCLCLWPRPGELSYDRSGSAWRRKEEPHVALVSPATGETLLLVPLSRHFFADSALACSPLPWLYRGHAIGFDLSRRRSPCAVFQELGARFAGGAAGSRETVPGSEAAVLGDGVVLVGGAGAWQSTAVELREGAAYELSRRLAHVPQSLLRDPQAAAVSGCALLSFRAGKARFVPLVAGRAQSCGGQEWSLDGSVDPRAPLSCSAALLPRDDECPRIAEDWAAPFRLRPPEPSWI